MKDELTSEVLHLAINRVINPFFKERSRAIMVAIRTKGRTDTDYYRGQLDLMGDLSKYASSLPTDD